MLGYYCRKYLVPVYSNCRFLTKIRIRPNGITLMSLIPTILGAIFVVKELYLPAAISVAVACIFDLLDGACARATSKVSKFGDYLDALVDRYKEIIVYFGFALSGYQLESLAALSGSLLVSFAKARTAMCVPIDDHDWPAIGDMADRFAILITGLVVAGFKPIWFSKYNFLSFTLIIVALLTHLGCIFRILYAKRIIESNQ